MKTDYQKYLKALSVFLLVIWILSCSGRAGKMKESGVNPSNPVNSELTSKLIRIISPEEDAGFKLNQPVKLILAPEDKKSVPDSVTVYFNGNFVTTIKPDHLECLIPPSFTVATCLLYTSPSPRDRTRSRMPSSA